MERFQAFHAFNKNICLKVHELSLEFTSISFFDAFTPIMCASCTVVGSIIFVVSGKKIAKNPLAKAETANRIAGALSWTLACKIKNIPLIFLKILNILH